MARMNLQVIRWTLVCLCVIHGIDANCPHGWKRWRDSCYILLTKQLNWHQASRVCGRPRSSMAVPNSFEENEIIHQMQVGSCQTGSACGIWIGCQRNPGGNVTCLDQKQEPFSNFDLEPADGSDCAMMAKSLKGKWLDTHFCSLGKKFICEMSRQVHVYSFKMASDGHVKSQCLRGHEIKNITAKGVIDCGAACWAEPQCHSFNLWQGGPTKICQLNNAKIPESNQGDVIYDDGCIYFELES